MTAQAFADLTHARAAGRGRWQAKCPAHPDKSPSLSITEGREGRVLLRCWAGCDISTVLAAMGLGMRDLFSAEPPTPAAAREAREARERRGAEAAHRAGTERRLADVYRRLTWVMDSLGRRLMLAPEDDALAATFQRACGLSWEVESPFPCGWIKAPAVKAWTPSLPFPEPNPDAAQAGRVRTEAELLRYIGTGWAEPAPRTQTEAEQKARSERALLRCA